MDDKQIQKLFDMLQLIQFELLQLDKMVVFIISCLLAGLILYVAYYILIRFTFF